MQGFVGGTVQRTDAPHLVEINEVDLLCTELSDTAVTALTPDRHIHAIAGGLYIQGEGLGLPLDIALDVEDHLSFQRWCEEDCNRKPGERKSCLLCSQALSFFSPTLPALQESCLCNSCGETPGETLGETRRSTLPFQGLPPWSKPWRELRRV